MMTKNLKVMKNEKFDPEKFISELEETIEWLENKTEKQGD
jgi:hypothetical protein